MEINLEQLDINIRNFKNKPKLSKLDVGNRLRNFAWSRTGEQYNIEWVSNKNTPITEFYCSEINVNWLVCFITTNTVKDPETIKLVGECQYLLDVLLNVKGINLVDYTFYLLEDDLMFVDYNVKKQIFI